jgi:catechol 2,3-dioxygenase-like lactoylglutathione lyase family enzyme
MPIIDLHHITIKTADLEGTVSFYNDILGTRSVPRPDFGFPGAWLALGQTMIHLYGGAAARNSGGVVEKGSAAVDHIAILAHDFDSMKKIALRHNLPYRQNNLPDANLWQLFLRDPNDVTIELNFPIDQEPEGSKGPDGLHPYMAGKL